MSREREVRRQKDAMEHAIEAHARGDKTAFQGAVREVERAGKAMGSRADVSGNREAFAAKKPAGPGESRRRKRWF